MPRKNFLGMLLGGAAFPAPLHKMAQTQSVRHAKKPVGQINGIDGSGNQDPWQGWQRAGALIPLIGASSAADPYQIIAPNLQNSQKSKEQYLPSR
jgi:hypothetical protein